MKQFALGTLFGVLLAVAVATLAMTLPAGQQFLISVYNTVASASAQPVVAADHDLAAPPFPSFADPGSTWPLRSLDGREADLADFEQPVVFVNRWATWCAPCVVEMPHIEKLAERFDAEDVAFVVVSTENADTVSAFVDEQAWSLPIYTASDAPPPFESDVLPATFVLDQARRVAFKHIGSARWDDNTSINFIENLLRSTAP